MPAHVHGPQGNERQPAANAGTRKTGGKEPAAGIADQRPEAALQRRLQAMADSSPQTGRLAALQAMADGRAARQSLPEAGEGGAEQPAQLRALTVGAGPAAPPAGGDVRQYAYFPVGSPTVGTAADVADAAERGDTLGWPQSENDGTIFNDDYARGVRLALDWGLAGEEGTAGWSMRDYPAADFQTIAQAAAVAIGGLADPLINDKNKTLIAVRAFRGPGDGSMAGRTLVDLRRIRHSVTEMGQVASIEAEPSEAHPGTLPTARVTFNDGSTKYFKGRSRSVEKALVGDGEGEGGSAARALSGLGGADAAAGVGMHGFERRIRGTAHLADNVGPEAAPAVDPVSASERARSVLPAWAWGVDVAPRQQAIDGWLSAAKTALLVALTATEDLHQHNIVGGRSGKAHIIDAEFLLDIDLWNAYTAMAAPGGALANFNVATFVPGWLRAHTATLSAGTKTLLATAVMNGFNALRADDANVQAVVLRPITALIATPALLRVKPFGTDQLLGFVTTFHSIGAGDRAGFLGQIWDDIAPGLHDGVTVNNPVAGQQELSDNFENGMVPLFHIRANDGALMLNKQLQIGNTVAGRGVANLLALARQAVAARYADMAAELGRVITA